MRLSLCALARRRLFAIGSLKATEFGGSMVRVRGSAAKIILPRYAPKKPNMGRSFTCGQLATSSASAADQAVGAGQANAKIPPTAPASSEDCSLCAAPTRTWNPTSFCRVFGLPTIVTADEDGGGAGVSPVQPGGDARPPSTRVDPASPASAANGTNSPPFDDAVFNMRGVTTSNVSVIVALRLTWSVP